MNTNTSPTISFRGNLTRLLTSPWPRVGIALAYTAILTVYLLQPHSSPVIAKPSIPGQPDLSREILRTFGHFATFSGLTLVWASALSAVWPFRRAMATTVISMAMFSAASEWAQSFVRGRSASIEDLSADILGIMLAAGVIAGVRWGLSARKNHLDRGIIQKEAWSVTPR